MNGGSNDQGREPAPGFTEVRIGLGKDGGTHENAPYSPQVGSWPKGRVEWTQRYGERAIQKTKDYIPQASSVSWTLFKLLTWTHQQHYELGIIGTPFYR